MGAAACRSLMASVEGEEVATKPSEFGMKLIVRQSTGPAPSSSALRLDVTHPTLKLPAFLEGELSRGHPWVCRDHVPRNFRARQGSFVHVTGGHLLRLRALGQRVSHRAPPVLARARAGRGLGRGGACGPRRTCARSSFGPETNAYTCSCSAKVTDCRNLPIFTVATPRSSPADSVDALAVGGAGAREGARTRRRGAPAAPAPTATAKRPRSF